MTIEKSIRLFLEHCEFEKNLSEKTILFYNIDLQQFSSFMTSSNVTKLEEIDKFAIKKYVQELSKFEPRTTKRKIASSKAFLNFLEFEDYITVNPYRKVKVRIKEPKQLPVVLEFEEVRNLLCLVKQEGNKVQNKKGHFYGEKLRDLAILELLFATGVRVSELCGLKPDQINLNSGRVLVLGKGNKERLVQICNPETLKILGDYFNFYKGRIQTAGFFCQPLRNAHF